MAFGPIHNNAPCPDPKMPRLDLDERVVVVVEKQSQIEMLRAVYPLRPDLMPRGGLTVISTNCMGHFRFRLPRGLKWADYPATPEMDLVWRDADRFPGHRIPITGGPYSRDHLLGRATQLDMDKTAPAEAKTAVADILRNTPVSQIVMATDPDARGEREAAALLKRMGGISADGIVRRLDPQTWAVEDMMLAWERAVTGSCTVSLDADNERLVYGEMAQTFDWLWTVNALPILGRAYLTALRRDPAAFDATPTAGPFVSKYMLLTLYILQSRPTATSINKLLRDMQDWTGSGRYERQTGNSGGIGSASSRGAIIDNLIGLRMAGESAVSTKRMPYITITPLGRRFLDLLHPDSFDPDLPFRLDTWCREGAAALPKMERYIRTMFGKTRRRLDQEQAAGGPM